MLKLKRQHVGHLMQRADSMEKTLILGKIEGRRRRGQQRMKWSDGITDSMHMSWANSRRWWRTGEPGVLQSMGLQRVKLSWVTEPQPPICLSSVHHSLIICLPSVHLCSCFYHLEEEEEAMKNLHPRLNWNPSNILLLFLVENIVE